MDGYERLQKVEANLSSCCHLPPSPDIEPTLPPSTVMLPREGKIQLNKEICTLFVGSVHKKLRRETKVKRINQGVIYLETITEALGGE